MDGMQPSNDMIIVLFFGRVADVMKTRRMEIPLPSMALSLYDLREQVFAGQAIAASNVCMSINQIVVRADQALQPGDEVAFFSVFSGG